MFQYSTVIPKLLISKFQSKRVCTKFRELFFLKKVSALQQLASPHYVARPSKKLFCIFIYFREKDTLLKSLIESCKKKSK